MPGLQSAMGDGGQDGLQHRSENTKDRGIAPAGAPALCLPHLELLLRHVDDTSVRQYLLLREAGMMERTAEDMQRYAIKHDALRRHLVSKEENDAPLLGLQLLTGHRNVNAIFSRSEILFDDMVWPCQMLRPVS